MGFIQIPLLIAIIAGVLVLGGVGYFGLKQYQSHRAKNPKIESNQSTTTLELSEVEKLRQEVEKLKKQSLQNQGNVSATTKDITVISTERKGVLTNAQIIAKIKPATVYISTQTAVGSGMIFYSDGYVLTNAHVVKGATDVDVSLYTGTTLSGNVVGRNEVADLAVIKLDTTKQLSKVEFADSDKVQQGDNVFTFGFPFGIEGDVSFKEGTISRRIERYFETSAEIHPGNSGGPLVDRYGQVIGVNTAIFGKSVGGVQLGETIKLAIPINDAKNIILKLMEGESVFLPPETGKVISSPQEPQEVLGYNPRVNSISPKFGTNETVFTITGSGFGSPQRNGDQVGVGEKNTEIISWADTEIKFKPTSLIIPGFFGVTLYVENHYQINAGIIESIKK